MKSLGERLKKERDKRGWSQVYVSQRLGMKRSSTYANWEYGLREPDAEMIMKIAELYEVSTDYLLGKTDKSVMDIEWLEDPRLTELINKLKLLPEEDQEMFHMQTKIFLEGLNARRK